MTETKSGAEFISEVHVRHVMRYVQARDWLTDRNYLIADAACGTGYGSRLLARAGHKILGIDFDTDAIDEAKKIEIEHCQFIKADLLTTKYSCGAIICIETLEHFAASDGRTLLENFQTWLPTLGRLIISTPYCEQTGPSPITKQHLCEYSLTDLERILNLSGFEIEIIKVQRHEGQAGRLGYAMAKAIKR